jgi:hypothetical protein
LRDSAGFAPDFAASAPAGDYVPDAASIALAVVDSRAETVKPRRRSKWCLLDDETVKPRCGDFATLAHICWLGPRAGSGFQLV